MNGLTAEFPDQLRVVSVDVQTSLGRELAREYGKFTPTFVFFDAGGKELWRAIGTLDPDEVRQLLQ
ncbi:MAG: thioredoxin family protein [Anaerolineales bacterium]|nr:thioredoxin family protein [Anaerolineales bacterium]